MRKFKIIFFIISFLSVTGICLAKEEESKFFQGIEFLSGFGIEKLHTQQTGHIIPIYVDFDFDLKPFTKKIGINPPGLLQFALEPFVSYVYGPKSDSEAGVNFVFKVGILPETSKFQPYLKASVGHIYMSQNTNEQATHYNYNEYGAGGFHYFFKKNTAFTLEYRIRHVSNGGRKSPNRGINTSFTILGISYLF